MSTKTDKDLLSRNVTSLILDVLSSIAVLIGGWLGGIALGWFYLSFIMTMYFMYSVVGNPKLKGKVKVLNLSPAAFLTSLVGFVCLATSLYFSEYAFTFKVYLFVNISFYVFYFLEKFSK